MGKERGGEICGIDYANVVIGLSLGSVDCAQDVYGGESLPRGH